MQSKSTKILLECNSKDRLRTIFEIFSNDISTPMDSFIFFYSGEKIIDLDKQLIDLAIPNDIQRRELNIFVFNKKEDNGQIKSNINTNEFKIIFSFEANQIDKNECRKEDKMRDICNTFAKKMGININSLYFLYNGQSFNLDYKIEELVNSLDKHIRGMTILVYKKNNVTEKLFNQLNSSQIEADSFRKFNLNEKNGNNKDLFQQNNQNYKRKLFCSLKNLRKIIIMGIGIFLSIALVSFLIIYYANIKTNKKEKSTVISDSVSDNEIILSNICEKGDGDKCSECSDNDNNICLKCNYGYDLYENECYRYLLSVNYYLTLKKEKTKLINQISISNILFMKINNDVLKPVLEFDFYNQSTSTVYFYIKKNESISLSYMFENIKDMKNISFNNVSNSDYIENMEGMLSGCSSLMPIDFSKFNLKKIKNISYLFSNCYSLKSLILPNFGDIQTMSGLFYNCSSLSNLSINDLNTENVSNMSYMFYNCNNLTNLDISSFKTQNVLDMSYMFSNCKNLKSLNLSAFNTEKVKNMTHMFKNCRSLESINLRDFKTQNVLDMSYMFYQCQSLTPIEIVNFELKM